MSIEKEIGEHFQRCTKIYADKIVNKNTIKDFIIKNAFLLKKIQELPDSPQKEDYILELNSYNIFFEKALEQLESPILKIKPPRP